MNDIMLCCVILHNMIVDEKRPLEELEGDEVKGQVRVSDEIEHCFERENIDRVNITPGTIASLCATNRYLNSAV